MTDQKLRKLFVVFAFIIAPVFVGTLLKAQPSQLILDREDGRITFAVDDVELPNGHIGWEESGSEIANSIHQEDGFYSDWSPQVIANSFADAENLYHIGEDVLFQMLLKAWCQHRPVVLTPDAIWLVICQQFSHYINQNPERYRNIFVNHEGKKELKIQTNDLFSDQADWEGLVARFTAEIDKYTNNDIATSLVADFSTTGIDERIASEVTLMDVVKPYFEYIAYYVVCGIPSITLTGTPDDWRNVLEKTRILNDFGLEWWASDLEPILEEFVRASEGEPDYWFWKDIVKKTRPRTIKGPSCGKRHQRMTKFDGWFLKLFPFDNDGRSPDEVTITQTMLSETVCVPFKYEIQNYEGNEISTNDLELVAGIVGVEEDPISFALTPKIGWFVRTTKPQELIERLEIEKLEKYEKASSIRNNITTYSDRPWNEVPLTWDDFSDSQTTPDVLSFNYYFSNSPTRSRFGNLLVKDSNYKLYMNPYMSWCIPEFRNDGTLSLLQTTFNYAELCRRKAQTSLFSSLSDIRNDVDAFFNEIVDNTYAGQDTVALQLYSDIVAAELADMQESLPSKPSIEPKGNAFGGHIIGPEIERYKSGIVDYFSPVLAFNLGFDFCINRLSVSMEVVSKGTIVNKEFNHKDELWKKGERLSGGNIDLLFGYVLWDTDWFRITPFAGIGVEYFDYQPEAWKEIEKKADEMAGFRQVAGISADIKLFRRLDKTYVSPYFKGANIYGNYTEFTLQPRFYVAHASFPGLPQAWSINFGVNINMLVWELRR